jgi:peptide subunit release factor 1 (eRF1)
LRQRVQVVVVSNGGMVQAVDGLAAILRFR